MAVYYVSFQFVIVHEAFTTQSTWKAVVALVCSHVTCEVALLNE